jgi:transmembrane sensor
VQPVRKENPAGQKSQLKLPDGTMVWLNSMSSLSYYEKFSDTLRLICLQGEAFFEVAESEVPFVVQTGNLETHVLGTAFNIDYYHNDEVRVSLVSGKALVMNEVGSMVLDPGEQIQYRSSNQVLIKKPFDMARVAGWKDGVLFFDNADLMDVVNSLERWYGVTITIVGNPSSAWAYQGIFNNQSLEVVLQRLSFSKEFDFLIEDKNVLIKF